MKRRRYRILAAVPAVLGALALVGCGGGDTAAPPQVITQTITAEPEPDPVPESRAGPNPTLATAAAETTATTAAPVGTGDPSGLSEVASGDFYRQDPGTVPGYRFSSPSGNINCHLTSMIGACHVAEHSSWPAGSRAHDALPGVPSSVVGWIGEYLDGTPRHWGMQGNFPAIDANQPLQYGQQITVQREVGGRQSTISCGSREAAMTCVIDGGQHGFTVSREALEIW